MLLSTVKNCPKRLVIYIFSARVFDTIFVHVHTYKLTVTTRLTDHFVITGTYALCEIIHR